MNAIRFERLIGDTVVRALPELVPLVGKRVEIIALAGDEPTRRALPPTVASGSNVGQRSIAEFAGCLADDDTFVRPSQPPLDVVSDLP